MSASLVRVRLAVVTLLLLTVAHSLPLCTAQPTITAVSGCAPDSSNVNLTMNCTLPINLTITGSGFTNSMNVRITTATTSFSCGIVTISTSNNTVYCYLYFRGASWIPPQTLTNLTAIDTSATPAVAGPAFAGVTFMPVVPTLTGVSGCMDVGNTTINCTPANATLTLIGSNFNELLGFYSTFSAKILSTGTSYGNIASVLSDTRMLFRVSTLYYAMFNSEAVYGTTVSVALCYGSDCTNFANFSLGPLPPPQITSISGINCLTSNALSAPTPVSNTTDCFPSFSLLSITGVYLYSVPITVGGWPCLVNQFNRDPTIAQAFRVICLPTLASGYIPGQLMDVTLNRTGLITVPAAVSFNSLPTITALSAAACPGDATGWNVYTNLKCAAGSTITITGMNYPTDSVCTAALTVQLWDRTHSTTIACLQAAVASATAITCVLPVPPDNSDAFEQFYFSGTTTTSVVLFYNQSLQSNVFPAGLYQSLAAPVVSSVTGCAGATATALNVSNCQVGDVLTVSGSNFLVGLDVMYRSVWSCSQVMVLSWSQLTCVIPGLGSLNTQIAYPLAVSGYVNGTLLASNPFYVSFTESSPSSLSSTSLSTATIAVVTVVVVLAGFVLVALALLAWRRKGRGRSSGATVVEKDKSCVPKTQPHSDEFEVTEMGPYTPQP